ncbi:unnamed protein product [Symbiodinium pilosum]|uniref:Uncharacterized protein n=1 Tax=Symbiodinium pilosum TaxID=2952 RepID=A0A812UZ85_SYMPI|nr:unnamed protein product [Symbiodinium pilosum]
MVEMESMDHGGLTEDLEPELLRGIPLHVALSGWGKHWADNGSGSLGTDSENSQGQNSYSLSSATPVFSNFLSHDWGTSRWEKLLAMMLLFNTKPAARATLVVSILTAAASNFLGPRIQAVLPVISYLCFWTFLCFAQRIFAMISKPKMVFLDKLCISQDDAVLKQKGILGLAAFLDRSKKLTILWSARYFSRLWCCYELATFLRHSTRKSIEIMPTKLAGKTQDATDESQLEKFNQTAQQELLPIVLDSVGTGQTCMSYFSAMVWAASLPSFIFWLPAYIENKHSFQGYELLVWWIRCCMHWAVFPLGILWYLHVYWWLCLLGLRMDKCCCQGRGILISFLLVIPLTLLGLGPACFVEFTRAATMTPSLLPLLPFSLLSVAVLAQRYQVPCASRDRMTLGQSQTQQAEEDQEMPNKTIKINLPSADTGTDEDLVSCAF